VPENPFLKKPADKPRSKASRFTSNEEIFQAYLEHVKHVHSSATHRGANYQVRKFLGYWNNALITKASRAELMEYVEIYEKACTSFRLGGLKPRGQDVRPNRCALGLPLDCANCPSYEVVKATTADFHFTMVSGLFNWLIDQEQVDRNEWSIVMRRWRQQNRRRLKKEVSARRLTKRFLSHAEMVQLIEGTKDWTWKIICLLGAKYFLRAAELARLKATSKYLDPDLEWIVVPLAHGNDGKRIVEVRYPIDGETREYLRVYLRWRSAKLARCGKTADSFAELIIHKNCKPFKENAGTGNSLSDGIRRAAVAARLKDPTSLESHVLRRFASDRAQENGVHGNELKLVRGDWLESDATGAYLDTSRLATLFAKACPPLGLRPPLELTLMNPF
jgi:hypothetical protein